MSRIFYPEFPVRGLENIRVRRVDRHTWQVWRGGFCVEQRSTAKAAIAAAHAYARRTASTVNS